MIIHIYLQNKKPAISRDFKGLHHIHELSRTAKDRH